MSAVTRLQPSFLPVRSGPQHGARRLDKLPSGAQRPTFPYSSRTNLARNDRNETKITMFSSSLGIFCAQAFMQHTGNGVANAHWEGNLPAGFQRPDSGQQDVRLDGYP